jgi:hypothetical protein
LLIESIGCLLDLSLQMLNWRSFVGWVFLVVVDHEVAWRSILKEFLCCDSFNFHVLPRKSDAMFLSCSLSNKGGAWQRLAKYNTSAF